MLARELENIGQKIALGSIPAELPVRAIGTWGVGRNCDVCDGTILAHEVEVIGHFRHHDSQCFHSRCFLHWWSVVTSHTAAGARATEQRGPALDRARGA
jgi:hypothetical protein